MGKMQRGLIPGEGTVMYFPFFVQKRFSSHWRRNPVTELRIDLVDWFIGVPASHENPPEGNVTNNRVVRTLEKWNSRRFPADFLTDFPGVCGNKRFRIFFFTKKNFMKFLREEIPGFPGGKMNSRKILMSP